MSRRGTGPRLCRPPPGSPPATTPATLLSCLLPGETRGVAGCAVWRVARCECCLPACRAPTDLSCSHAPVIVKLPAPARPRAGAAPLTLARYASHSAQGIQSAELHLNLLKRINMKFKSLLDRCSIYLFYEFPFYIYVFLLQ